MWDDDTVITEVDATLVARTLVDPNDDIYALDFDDPIWVSMVEAQLNPVVLYIEIF